MKIVVAPDSYKGTLSASAVCGIIADEIRANFKGVEVDEIPVADGGEGTVDAMVVALRGQHITCPVTDPLGRRIEAQYGMVEGGRVAVIGMAAASGLPLVKPNERNPKGATTYGTGELIRDALDRGAKKIIIGIGGSATVDGGAGMAQALGARLLDKDGQEIARGGAALADLDEIEFSSMHPRLKEVVIEVACDVDNPLTGPQGAARVYGPQKGAAPEDVEILERALTNFSNVFHRDFGHNLQEIAGGGAAGGLGAGLVAFCGAEMRRGADIVLSAVNLRERCRGARLVITGEGRMDGQTVYGKAPIGVAARAKAAGVPNVFAINGSAGPGIEAVLSHGIDKYYMCFTDEEVSSLSPADLAARTPDRLRRLTRLALEDTSP